MKFVAIVLSLGLLFVTAAIVEIATADFNVNPNTLYCVKNNTNSTTCETNSTLWLNESALPAGTPGDSAGWINSSTGNISLVNPIVNVSIGSLEIFNSGLSFVYPRINFFGGAYPTAGTVFATSSTGLYAEFTSGTSGKAAVSWQTNDNSDMYVKGGNTSHNIFVFDSGYGGRTESYFLSPFVGVGTTQPDVQLHVSDTSADQDVFRIVDSNGNCAMNPGSGSITTSCTSSTLLKENEKPVNTSEVYNDLLLRATALRSYDVSEDGTHIATGFIAEELEKTHPELVKEIPVYEKQLVAEIITTPDGDVIRYTYEDVQTGTVKTAQLPNPNELLTLIVEQEKRILSLETRLALLEVK